MEFNCLHCRERLTVDDELTGERVACPNCSGMVTVPKPIGGRLTERRIAASAPPPPVLPTKKKPLRAVSEEEAIPKANGPEEPSVGFRFETRLPKILGRNERDAIEHCLEDAVAKLESHLDRHPQFFRSGSFVLELEHLNVILGGHEARFRLFGSLNHQPFATSASIAAGRAKHRIPTPKLPLVILETIESSVSHQSPMQLRCSKVLSSAVRQFCHALDDSVERPVGFLSKFWRWFVENL